MGSGTWFIGWDCAGLGGGLLAWRGAAGAAAGSMMTLSENEESEGAISSGSESDNSSTRALRDIVNVSRFWGCGGGGDLWRKES